MARHSHLQTLITMTNRLQDFDTRPLHILILPPRARSSGEGLVHLGQVHHPAYSLVQRASAYNDEARYGPVASIAGGCIFGLNAQICSFAG